MTSIPHPPHNCIHSLEWFVNLTQKAYAPYMIDADRVLRSRIGWSRLADLWEELIDYTGLDIFSDILYLIKWGHLYSQPPNRDYSIMAEAASKELLADTPAFHAWTKHYFFSCYIQGLSDELYLRPSPHPYCHSTLHHQFADSVMTVKLWRYQHGHKGACKTAVRFIDRYKKAITKLIPNARSWDAEYWLEENHILDEIFRVHHVDYRNALNEYTCLLRLLTQTKGIPKCMDSYSLMYLCNLTTLSPSLVSSVWSSCNSDTLVQLFLLAEKRAYHLFESNCPQRVFFGRFSCEDITYALLHRSWLFSHFSQQLYSGTISQKYVSKIKRAVLNIELRR